MKRFPVAELPSNLNKNDCISLAKRCELDKETVWQQDFWAKLQKFAQSDGEVVQEVSHDLNH